MKPLTLEQKIENLKKREAIKQANKPQNAVQAIINTKPAMPARGPKGRFLPKTPSQVIPIVTKKVNTETRVAFIVDASGSMSAYYNKPTELMEHWLKTTKEAAASTGEKTRASIYHFNNVVTNLVNNQAIEHVTNPHYQAMGGTALRDAIKLAVNNTVDKTKDNISYLFIVITDGEENESKNCTHEECRALIESLQKTNNFTFAFLVPPNNTWRMTALGALPGNVQEWEQSIKGIERASFSTANSLKGYYGARSAGATMSASFFRPDLSGVDSKLLASKFVDISNRAKLYTADKEEVIKPFVEAKTKQPYAIGTVYYQLIKPEKVQPAKLVLIREKTTGAIYAGNDARETIGLPMNKEIKIEPGNHGNFDVFVQSTSTNRILPRGTKIVVLQ